MAFAVGVHERLVPLQIRHSHVADARVAPLSATSEPEFE
jgi:hypothetical protein